MPNENKPRYVLVGAGGRATMYIDALSGPHRDHGTLVAMCDLSQVRMDYHNARIARLFGVNPVATYKANQFDQMLRDVRPQVVIVCTVDATHHEYIVRSMEAGCDVICEKPITTDAPKLRTVFEAINRTSRALRVAHNARYAPMFTKVKQLLQERVIGRPLHVSMMYTLDTQHGADYFHRWHREKDQSGGLLIHKASHHFDMINWWIEAYPKTVYCAGALKFYGRQNAERRGERVTYDRYTGHPEAARDPFAIFLDQEDRDGPQMFPALRGLYYNAEAETGYVRDRNVFGDNITIEDTIAITATYRSGVHFSYSLVAYSPSEGFRAAITGDKGRIEVTSYGGSHVFTGDGLEPTHATAPLGHQRSICVLPMFGNPYEVEIPKADGAHGGGDKLILQDLFDPDSRLPDPFNRAATHLDGAATVLMGIAANESIRTGLPVDCDQLLPLPETGGGGRVND